MCQLTLREIQLAELEILKEFDRVCRENNLNYSLSCGTLLGAVRHKGFIPWDDDVDVEMPRPDYEKLYSLITEGSITLNNGLELTCDRGANAEYPYLKIVDKNYKVEGICSVDNFLWIDIFPLDGYAKEYKTALKRNNKVQKLRRLLAYNYLTLKNERGVKALAKKLYKVFARTHKPYKLIEKINRISKLQPYEDCDFAGCIYYKTKKIIRRISKNQTETLTELEFEGIRFKAYECYDEYLSALYGDYMQIPKEHEHHGLKCYKDNKI